MREKGGLFLRIKVNFALEDNLILPSNYNHIIQKTIYNSIRDDKFRELLHDRGFTFKNKAYKLFTFSNLMGNFEIKNKGEITFLKDNNLSLIISSELSGIITELLSTFSSSDKIRLGNMTVRVNSVKLEKDMKFKDNINIKLISPLVTYITKDKKTIYINPKQEKFSSSIRNNLLCKYACIHGKEPDNKRFIIKSMNNNRYNQKSLMKYKGIIIEGYRGIYKLEGNPELIKLSYNTGLGSKNSQGFGCWVPL